MALAGADLDRPRRLPAMCALVASQTFSVGTRAGLTAAGAERGLPQRINS